MCPHSAVHTNSIEAMWSNAKSKLRNMRGTSQDLFPTYIDEFIWKRQHNSFQFQNLIAEIANIYIV